MRPQVLALTLAEAKLYEGTRDTLEIVSLEGAPTTIEAALGAELTEPYSKSRGVAASVAGRAP